MKYEIFNDDGVTVFGVVNTERVVLSECTDLQLKILMCLAEDYEHYEYCALVRDEMDKRINIL